MGLEYALDTLEPLLFVLRGLLERVVARLGLEGDRLHPPRRSPSGSTTGAATRATLALAAPTRDVRTLLTCLRVDLEARPPRAAVERVLVAPRPRACARRSSGSSIRRGPRPSGSRRRSPASPRSAARTASAPRPSSTRIGRARPPSRPSCRRRRTCRTARAPPRRARSSCARSVRRVPIEVFCDRDRPDFVRGDGLGGRVVAAAGPWRLAGEWWSERAPARATTTTSSSPTAASTAASASSARAGGSSMACTTDYVELRCRSAFCFLAGASLPEDLVDARRGARLRRARARRPRRRLRRAALLPGGARRRASGRSSAPSCALDGGGRAAAPRREPRAATATSAGCSPRTKLGRAEGRGARPRWDDARGARATGSVCLAGGADGPARAGGATRAARRSPASRGIFGRARSPSTCSATASATSERLARRARSTSPTRCGLPAVATNDVRHAAPDGPRAPRRAHLHPREARRSTSRRPPAPRRTPSGTSSRRPRWPRSSPTGPTLLAQRRAHRRALRVHARGPRLPLPRLSRCRRARRRSRYLRALTDAGARERYRPHHADGPRASSSTSSRSSASSTSPATSSSSGTSSASAASAASSCQGRGSAANSAVCYALGITAVDPVGMELLFERFLSEERGEWPDIDLDLPSGDRRERVIQYVYQRYGARGAAMTANVITYRDAQRRARGRQGARLLARRRSTASRSCCARFELRATTHDDARGAARATAASTPTAPRVRAARAARRAQIQDLPRHLGQHSGGMVIAAGPARRGRAARARDACRAACVVQWDKDDCADLGIIKVDLLGLGMMAALEDAIPLVRAHEGVDVDLAHLPPDDPKVYAMLRAPTPSASSRSRAARRWRRCRA